jgi:PhnB protein
MAQLIPYLSFNGNCREAMEFYSDCLKAELILEYLGDSPLGNNLPDRLKSYVFQASLKKGDMLIIASDVVPDSGLKLGNTVSLYVHFKSAQELREVFQKLAFSGEELYPLHPTHWNQLFGGVIDKYGIHWLLSSGYNTYP